MQWDIPAQNSSFAELSQRLHREPEEQHGYPSAIPDVSGPFEDAGDFIARALITRTRTMRRYSAVSGQQTVVILLPEEYAAALEAVRRFRLFQDGAGISPECPEDLILDPALLQRVLPEDVLSLVDSAPGSHCVSQVVLLDEPNPADLWHRQATGTPDFVSAATTVGQEIRFFARDRTSLLRDEFLHAWALCLYEERAVEQEQSFEAAAEIEADGYYARPRAQESLKENWAIHLGECLLHTDGAVFDEFTGKAPIRCAVIGKLLQYEFDGVWSERSDYLRQGVRLQALHTLMKRTPLDNAAMRLLVRLWQDGDTPLPGLEAVKELDLAGLWIGNKGLGALVQFSSLERLDLSNTSLGMAGESPTGVCELTNLRWLSLAGTRIPGIRGVTSLKNLEYLDLSGTPLHEAPLILLDKLPRLRHVNLTGVYPTADIEEYRVAELQRLMPDCVFEVR